MYYHIGETKLRNIVEAAPPEELFIMNGNKMLVERERFERYLYMATAV